MAKKSVILFHGDIRPALVRIKVSKARLFLLAFILFNAASPAFATWSIIAVDRNTDEVGIAGASCTFDVSGIASVVPGKGAIVVQAASNYLARMKGVDLMEEGATVEQVLNAMQADEFTPQRQQYGVITLQDVDGPLTHSGAEISSWNGAQTAADVAVMGNLLVSQSVVEDAFIAFNNSRHLPLGDRLIAALTAGADAGGDNRCGEQKARSAFMMLYSPNTGSITELSVFGIEKGGQAAVPLLKGKFSDLNQK